MEGSSPETLFFWVFTPIWVLVILASWIFFRRGRSASLKRRAFLPFSIGVGALFMIMVITLGAPPSELLLAAGFTVLSVFFSHRATRFCDTCGATNIGKSGFAPPAYCSECGTKLAP